MFLVNGALNMICAPQIGKLIDRWGERRSLTVEYIGLVIIFLGYAFVQDPWIAVTLYILDHLFFSMAIAMKTYFQKIAAPKDMAPTAGVSFTINHIAAVILPAAYGGLWIILPAAVVIRLHCPDRQGIEKRTGKDWSQEVDPKDKDISLLAEMLEDLSTRGIESSTFVNNHFKGSAPRTIAKIEDLLEEK